MPQNTFANAGIDLVGHTIDNGRLELVSTLGVGAYGVVYLAVDLHAPTPVYLAVKCLLRTGLDARQRHFQRREIALHQMASRHPGIVTLHKVMEEGDFTFVIMDFYDEGDLFAMITEKQRIVDAVEYCHMMGIFHRDLKPENILVTRDGEKVCIADFGLATSERTSTDFGCGSTFYLSPECQGGLFERLDRYSTEHNDLWSLGVILVNLTCGRNPWRQACASDETFKAYVHDPDFLRTILPVSAQTNHILKGLFALDPAHRTPLQTLRKQIMQVRTFTMTDDELSGAHAAARAAAQAVRQQPIPAPAPVVAPVPVYAPAPPVYAVPHVSPQRPTPAYQPKARPQHVEYSQPPSPPRYAGSSRGSWSSESAYDDLEEFGADDDMDVDIDIASEPELELDLDLDTCSTPGYTPQTPVYAHAGGDPFAFVETARTARVARATQARGLRLDTRCALNVPASTRSSGSGSGSEGMCQPSTPEFVPADRKVREQAQWEVPRKLAQVPRARVRGADVRVGPVSPLSSEFAFR